jgi:hypothetical protein
LGDAHSGFDDESGLPVRVVKNDTKLAPVPRVDETRRVHDRDPVLDGEPGARGDEARVARRDRDRDPGADERPLARRQLVVLAGDEVEAGVARVRSPGQDGVVPQPRDGDLDHAAGVARRPRVSATRNRANRFVSRAGRRARISTPSSRSIRDSIGGPSA